MSDLSSHIESVAGSAKSTSLDGVTTTEQDLDKLIMADKYLAAKNATANQANRGLRFNKLVPPGTAGT
jgi:hypothetical protein